MLLLHSILKSYPSSQGLASLQLGVHGWQPHHWSLLHPHTHPPALEESVCLFRQAYAATLSPGGCRWEPALLQELARHVRVPALAQPTPGTASAWDQTPPLYGLQNQGVNHPAREQTRVK